MAKSVRDAMTDDPRSIGAVESVVAAARLMRDEHIGSLPVTEDKRLASTTRALALGVTSLPERSSSSAVAWAVRSLRSMRSARTLLPHPRQT